MTTVPALAGLMTLDEVATYLRRPASTMRWMRHKRVGPPSAKIGGRVMYRQDEVDAWIEAQFAQDATAQK